jgi:hypothetical protein
MPGALLSMALAKVDTVKSEGSLIISPLSTTPGCRKKKRTKNRKTKTCVTHFEYGGECFEVMTRSGNGKSQYSIYVEIMNRIIEQMSAAFFIHGRIVVQHFILSTSHYTEDNAEWSKFRKRLIIQMNRKFGAQKSGYVWVRESESIKKQHYHVFLAIDGQKVWHGDGLGRFIKKLVGSSEYFTSVNLAGFHQVLSKSDFNDMIYHASYMAKTRGKGYRHERANDFGGSQLKPVKQGGSRGGVWRNM